MSSRSAVVLAAVLRACKPLVRLLMRNGVAYPAFATALKQVFLEAAVDELRAGKQKQTDSAISLLSGVHRRDVRNLAQSGGAALAMEAPMNMASQVVARWVTDAAYRDRRGQPRSISRSGPAPSLEALVLAISSDVRPRAVLDELVRLGMAREEGDSVHLLAPGFVPRAGLDEMAALLADNLHDHAAAACLNVEGGHNFLEQSLFVDQLTAASAHRLHVVSARAWRVAFREVMEEAQSLYDHDQSHAAPAERVHRARFGGYFYSDDHENAA